MIRSFRHKGLSEMFYTGASTKVPANLARRVMRILVALDHAATLSDLAVASYGTHPLRTNPVRYAMSVNGPWRITFEFRAPDAWLVDLEQYH